VCISNPDGERNRAVDLKNEERIPEYFFKLGEKIHKLISSTNSIQEKDMVNSPTSTNNINS
jgi:hypothetical protein